MSFSRRTLSFLASALLLALPALAEVKLPALLAEHMVVQRDLPVHVWGTAAPGEAVSVTFRGETRSASPDTFGRWSLYLSAGAAGGPFELSVKASNTITLTDVLVGDVWVASGQSNMEMAVNGVKNAKAEIAAANYPQIRLVRALNRVAYHPLEDIAAHTWVATTPETIGEFSAAAYFFVIAFHGPVRVKVVLDDRDSCLPRGLNGLLDFLDFLIPPRPAINRVGKAADHQVAQGQTARP